jgi:hypothetical protein
MGAVGEAVRSSGRRRERGNNRRRAIGRIVIGSAAIAIIMTIAARLRSDDQLVGLDNGTGL